MKHFTAASCLLHRDPRARAAKFSIAEKCAYPVSSIAASKVIHTMRVEFGSSQMEESRILVNSLLYTPEYELHHVTRQALP